MSPHPPAAPTTTRATEEPCRETGAAAGATSPRLGPLVLATMAAQSLLVVLAPTMVELGREFGVSVAEVGQARAIAAASAIAASLVVAGLIDRVGLRRMFTLGATLAMAGCAAIAAAPSLAAFLTAHCVTGIAFACLLSAALAGVAAFPRERSVRAMGYVIGANALAWIITGPLGGLLTDVLSWRAAYAVPVALAVAALAGARRATPLPVGCAPGSRKGLLGVVADQRARRWLAAEVAAWFMWATVLTYGGAFLVERHTLSESAAGADFALAAGAFFVGSLRSARLVERFARRRLIASAALVMGALAPLQFIIAASAWVTVALLCLLAFCSGIRTSASAGLGLAQMPSRPGTIMTAHVAVAQLGYLIGAVTGAATLGAWGYAALGLVLGGAMLVSAVFVTRVVDPRQRADPTPARQGRRHRADCTAVDAV